MVKNFIRFLKYICPFFNMHERVKTSAIRQKSESQSGCYKKTKHIKFSTKRTFLTPYVCAYLVCVCVSGSKKCSFFGKFGLLCSPVTHVLRFALFFTLLTTKLRAYLVKYFYRKNIKKNQSFYKY